MFPVPNEINAMLTTNSQVPLSSQLLSHPPGELLLRVVTPQTDRQLRIDANKISVGSAESCTVQVAGLKPVHCLILRGPRRLAARRWATPATLNGENLVDALLSVGDVIQLGEVRILIQGVQMADTDDDGLATTNEAESQETHAAAELQSLKGEFAAREEAWLRREEELRQDIAVLQQEQLSLQRATTEQQLQLEDRFRDQLDQLQQQLQSEQATWQASRQTFQQQIESRKRKSPVSGMNSDNSPIATQSEKRSLRSASRPGPSEKRSC